MNAESKKIFANYILIKEQQSVDARAPINDKHEELKKAYDAAEIQKQSQQRLKSVNMADPENVRRQKITQELKDVWKFNDNELALYWKAVDAGMQRSRLLSPEKRASEYQYALKSALTAREGHQVLGYNTSYEGETKRSPLHPKEWFKSQQQP